ncbi:MAG: RnfABCDGE type electron transport complex subunit B [Methylococcaceae bacterium]
MTQAKTFMIEQLNNLLPQTQCGQCSFKGCLPYAEAIATGTAEINQCPPGGDDGIAALAHLLGVSPKPLNPAFGEYKPKQVAFIIEKDCIGCVKCIAACPVDAILGAAKLLHTVISDECTGCELCIAPCPVDCIVMHPVSGALSPTEKYTKAQLAKRRYEQRAVRLAKLADAKLERARLQKAAFAHAKVTRNEPQ